MNQRTRSECDVLPLFIIDPQKSIVPVFSLKKVLSPYYVNTSVIHQSLSYTGSCGWVQPIPAVIRRRRSTPWTDRQFITGLTCIDKQPCTVTPTGKSEYP